MDNRISFRVDEETARRLRGEAKQRKTTMTAILKEAIREQWKRFCQQPVGPKLSAKPKH